MLSRFKYHISCLLILFFLHATVMHAQNNSQVTTTELEVPDMNDSLNRNLKTSDSSKTVVQDRNSSLDSTTLSTDNTAIDSIKLLDKNRLNPKKAGLYSALVPGGGQIYNKEYWKLSVVYAAIGTGVGFIIHNNRNYNSARLEYSKRLSLQTDLNERYERYDMNMLQQEQEYYKEYLDMSVLLTSLGYILQIMDAVAFNHLKGFDISPDISMRFKMSELNHNQIGLGIAFSLK